MAIRHKVWFEVRGEYRSSNKLCYVMKILSHCMICVHVNDEMIIKCQEDASFDAICE